MNKDRHHLVEQLTKELLSQLLVEVQVIVSEKDGAVQVALDTDDAGVLIGHKGRNLESLQILLGQLVFKKTNEWIRIVVTVGDYRERQEKELFELAQRTASQVVETGIEIPLTDLSPGERRLVHMALSDHPGVVSESHGEGRDRKLVVKPKS